MRLDQLTFAREPHAARGYHWATPVVNGVPLPALVAGFEWGLRAGELAGDYAGIIINESGDPLVDDLLQDGRISLLGCTCGETGCWPLEAAVRFDDWSVTWDDFCQPHRREWSYLGFGPFVFPAEAYRQAVESLRRG